MKDETIIDYLNDELQPGARIEVEKWKDSSTENNDYFNRIKLIWENSKEDFEGITVNPEKAWRNIQSSIDNEEEAGRHINFSFGLMAKVAATIAILIAAGILFYRTIDGNEWTETNWISAQTTNDRTDVVLPDNTHVWLNRNSEIRYPSKFRGEAREVVLSGEAFFEVSKVKGKSFSIAAGESVIQVLGTSFNVKAVKNDPEINVTVVTGSVAMFQAGDRSNQLILEPGDQGTFITGNKLLLKRENVDKNLLAWKTNVLVFQDDPLADVCEILSRHFGLTVELDEDEVLESKRLTAIYDNKSIEDILSILTETLNISYERSDGLITLYSNPVSNTIY